MRINSLNTNFLMSPYLRANSLYRSNTARSIAKRMVKEIGMPGLPRNTDINDMIKKIDSKVSAFKHDNDVRYPDYRFNNNYNAINGYYGSKLSSLANISDKLMNINRNSVFNEVGIKSSNNGIADFNATKRLSADNKGFELSVDSLAGAQSYAFAPIKNATQNAAEDFGFSIKVGNNDKSFSALSIDAVSGKQRSSKDMLNDIVNQVNNSKIGIKASVTEDKDGAVLKLESEKTGKSNIFEVYNGKDALANGKVTNEATDAQYTIKNNNFTQKFASDTNDIKIGYNGVEAKLKAKGTTKVSFEGLNKDKVTKALDDMVNNFNDVSDIIKADAANKYNFKDLVGMKDKLSKIGIDYDDLANKLAINKDNQNKAFEEQPGEIKKLIGGVDGLAMKIKTLSSDSLKNLNNHLSEMKPSFMNNGFVNRNRNSFNFGDFGASSWLNNPMNYMPTNNIYGFNKMFSIGSLLNYNFL